MQSTTASAAAPAAPAAASKRSAARRGGAQQQQQQLKLQVRGLPLGITLQQFEQACGEFLDGCDWRRLTHSNKCYKVAQCSVWLAFKSYDKLHSFHKRFDGHKFVDEKGVQHTCSIQFAPFQRVPRKQTKPDLKMGTIEQDEDYIQFLEQLKQAPKMRPSAEQQLLENEGNRQQPVVKVSAIFEEMRQRYLQKLARKQQKHKQQQKSAVSSKGRPDPKAKPGRRGNLTVIHEEPEVSSRNQGGAAAAARKDKAPPHLHPPTPAAAGGGGVARGAKQQQQPKAAISGGGKGGALDASQQQEQHLPAHHDSSARDAAGGAGSGAGVQKQVQQRQPRPQSASASASASSASDSSKERQAEGGGASVVQGRPATAAVFSRAIAGALQGRGGGPARGRGGGVKSGAAGASQPPQSDS